LPGGTSGTSCALKRLTCVRTSPTPRLPASTYSEERPCSTWCPRCTSSATPTPAATCSITRIGSGTGLSTRSGRTPAARHIALRQQACKRDAYRVACRDVTIVYLDSLSQRGLYESAVHARHLFCHLGQRTIPDARGRAAGVRSVHVTGAVDARPRPVALAAIATRHATAAPSFGRSAVGIDSPCVGRGSRIRHRRSPPHARRPRPRRRPRT